MCIRDSLNINRVGDILIGQSPDNRAPDLTAIRAFKYATPPYSRVKGAGVFGSITRELGAGSVLIAFQFPSPSVLLNIPRHVPTYSVVGVSGSIARADMCPPSGPILFYTICFTDFLQ